MALFVLVASVAFAGNKNDLAYLGYNELDTTASVGLTDEIVVFESDVPKQGGTVADIVNLAGNAAAIISSATAETLTTAVDGDTLVYTAGGEKELPVSTGFTYPLTFVAASGDTLSIDPFSTDTIYYGDTALDAGDKISSSGTTGDTVVLYPTSGGWYAGFHADQWSDGGA